jgi:hypothetical protein
MIHECELYAGACIIRSRVKENFGCARDLTLFMLENSLSSNMTSQTVERFYVLFLKKIGLLKFGGKRNWKLGYRGCCTKIILKFLINKNVIEKSVSFQGVSFH